MYLFSFFNCFDFFRQNVVISKQKYKELIDQSVELQRYKNTLVKLEKCLKEKYQHIKELKKSYRKTENKPNKLKNAFVPKAETERNFDHIQKDVDNQVFNVSFHLIVNLF